MIKKLAKLDSNPLLSLIELERHTTGLWCTYCEKSRHLIQFCNPIPQKNQYF